MNPSAKLRKTKILNNSLEVVGLHNLISVIMYRRLNLSKII